MIRTILYVDDDSDDHFFLKTALKKIDPTIILHSAYSGLEGIEQLGEMKLPDLVFIDLNMPLMSGKELLETIRKNPRYNKLPVVIYTTSNREEDKQAVEKYNILAYVVKRTSIDQIVEIISPLLVANAA